MDNTTDTTLQQEQSLLFVDDEENILRSLVRACRCNGYKIFTATSGPDALKVLDENEIQVVVSDQRMAIMSGIDFLKNVKARFPHTVRIVLSGYTDLDAVTQAINEGEIYKFIAKPWEDDALREALEEAFRHFELIDRNRKLTAELTNVNEHLERSNVELKNHLEIQRKNAEMNINVMNNTQEILEMLPVAVIGIDDTGMVAIANNEARKIFGADTNALVGQSIENVSDGELFVAYRKMMHSSKIIRDCTVIDGKGQLQISGRQRTLDNNAKGVLMVINNIETSET